MDNLSNMSVVLRPIQEAHANRLLSILTRPSPSWNMGVMDLCRPGRGKTHIALWLAQKLGLSVLVVCPASVVDVWVKWTKHYEIDTKDIISYDKLRASEGFQPKHGLLTRHDSGGKTNTLSFQPTDELRNFLRKPSLVIIDELQKVKNNTSAQYHATKALIRQVLLTGGQSRFAFLSGSPLCKEEESLNFLRVLGFIKHRNLYRRDPTTHELVIEGYGMGQLINACQRINSKTTNMILDTTPISRFNMKELCFRMFNEVVKAEMSSRITSHDILATGVTSGISEYKLDAMNGFYNIDGDYEENLRQAVDELAKAVEFDDETGEALCKDHNFKRTKRLLMLIEYSKVELFVRLAKDTLEQDPLCKVLLVVNYRDTANRLHELLSDYDPILLNGSVSPARRTPLIQQFDLKEDCRLIIANPIVISLGISMNDTDGRYKRYMYDSPNYDFLNKVQLPYRIYREGQKSHATYRVVYCKGVPKEMAILQSMATKSVVLRSITECDEVIYPGEFPEYIET